MCLFFVMRYMSIFPNLSTPVLNPMPHFLHLTSSHVPNVNLSANNISSYLHFLTSVPRPFSYCLSPLCYPFSLLLLLFSICCSLFSFLHFTLCTFLEDRLSWKESKEGGKLLFLGCQLRQHTVYQYAVTFSAQITSSSFFSLPSLILVLCTMRIWQWSYSACVHKQTYRNKL